MNIYLKKKVTEKDLDTMRAWLVVHGMERQMPPEPVCDFCGMRTPEWLLRLNTDERKR